MLTSILHIVMPRFMACETLCQVFYIILVKCDLLGTCEGASTFEEMSIQHSLTLFAGAFRMCACIMHELIEVYSDEKRVVYWLGNHF